MIQLNKPGAGFSLKKEATPMNDSYRNYADSVIGNDEIWSALTTEAGRQALGAQMAER